MSIFGKLVSAIFGSSHAAEPAPASHGACRPQAGISGRAGPVLAGASIEFTDGARAPAATGKRDVASRARSPDQEDCVGAAART